MNVPLSYVVCAPPYDENSGGAVVLYKLYSTLMHLQLPAYLQPFQTGEGNSDLIRRRILRYFPRLTTFRNRRLYVERSPYSLRFASPSTLRNAVVIYPEVIDGNPLGSKRVVRWFLHRPGYHTGRVDFGPGDLCFYLDKQFDDPRYNQYPENHLRVLDYLSHVYFENNNGARSGSCYLVRKGNDVEHNYHPSGAEKLDGMSHVEMARAFNRCEYFFSYDLYTMYSRFAAICGCKSIVVPRSGLAIDEWYADPENRFGVAYGLTDLPRAQDTRTLLLASIARAEEYSRESVSRFVARCEAFFRESGK